jgi:molecular chaperone GrpE
MRRTSMRIPIEISCPATPKYGMRYPDYGRPDHILGRDDLYSRPLQFAGARGEDGHGLKSRTKPEGECQLQDRQDEKPFKEESAEPAQAVDEQQETLTPEDKQVDWKERYTRLYADFDNYKRKATKDRHRLVGLGKEALLEDILPLVEYMERGIQAAKDMSAPEGIVEGLVLISNELVRALEKHGVKRVKTVGEPFDPEVHEAVSVIPEERYSEDTVVEEIRPGFLRDGKLLRAASVIVSKCTSNQDEC